MPQSMFPELTFSYEKVIVETGVPAENVASKTLPADWPCVRSSSFPLTVSVGAEYFLFVVILNILLKKF